MGRVLEMKGVVENPPPHFNEPFNSHILNEGRVMSVGKVSNIAIASKISKNSAFAQSTKR